MCVSLNLRVLLATAYFNVVQSSSFEIAFQSNDSLVVAAPTGSGKTGVLELALCRLFGRCGSGGGSGALAIYLAPLKALTHERLIDWQPKVRGQHRSETVRLL